MSVGPCAGDDLLRLPAALSSPHRLRILARLAEKHSYAKAAGTAFPSTPRCFTNQRRFSS